MRGATGPVLATRYKQVPQIGWCEQRVLSVLCEFAGAPGRETLKGLQVRGRNEALCGGLIGAQQGRRSCWVQASASSLTECGARKEGESRLGLRVLGFHRPL